MPHLEGWTTAYPVPETIKDQLPEALQEAEEGLTPAPADFIAVEVEKTLSLYPTPEHFEGEFYLEVFDNVPADLVAYACRKVRETHRFNTCPLPADFAFHMKDFLKDRKAEYYRLRSAHNKAFAPKPITKSLFERVNDRLKGQGEKPASNINNLIQQSIKPMEK